MPRTLYVSTAIPYVNAPPLRVVLDTSYVYWTNYNSSGTVMKIAKQ